MTAKRTHEDYVNLVAIENPNIEVLGEYVGANIPIEVRCKLDGYTWTPNARVLYRGKGCPKCAKVAQKTHDEFLSEMAILHPNIEVIGNYVSSKMKIQVRCKIDGHVWFPTAGALVRGTGCQKCYRISQKMTHDQFISKIYSLRNDILILGGYTSTRAGVLTKCVKCSHEWNPTPNKLLSGTGCPECDRLTKVKSDERFVAEVSQINPDLEITGKYRNNFSGVETRCRKCGYSWKPLPKCLINGSGCPCCGTNNGFHKDRPAVFYVYVFGDYCGFGITGDYKTRSNTHKRNFKKSNMSFDVVLLLHCSGEQAYVLEKIIKQNLPKVNTGVEGFKTEAIHADDKAKLLDMIDNFCHENNLTFNKGCGNNQT